MINFTYLPRDGVKFEQLIRELFISIGFETVWTGVGPDGGKDLIVTEKRKGMFGELSKRWLVSCKHNAESNRAVGVHDIVNISDAMRTVNATGFVLACSTYPSSSLVRRLDELSATSNTDYVVLDGVAIEKLILTPGSFFLLNRFFPEDERNNQWNVFSTDELGVWSASYKGHFFFYTSRDRITNPPLSGIETIIEVYDKAIEDTCSRVREAICNNSYQIVFRYRGFYWDDKHCHYLVYLDCQLGDPKEFEVESFVVNCVRNFDETAVVDDQYAHINNIDLRFAYPNFISDHYHEDSYEDYNPFYRAIRKGRERGYDNTVW
jgi:hypothetical protein